MATVPPLCTELEAGPSVMYYEAESSDDVHACNYADYTSKREVEERVKEQEPERSQFNKRDESICGRKINK